MAKVFKRRYEEDTPDSAAVSTPPPRTVSHEDQIQTGLIKRADNFVPAKVGQVIDTTAIQRVADSAMLSTNGEVDSSALASLATNIETSRPVERALASSIRALLIILIVAIPLAAAVFLATENEPVMWVALALFAILAIVWVYRNDNRHSPAGIEHGKIDGYVAIRHAEIESNERVAMKKIDAFMDTLNRVYGKGADE